MMDIIELIILYFMVLTNGNIWCVYIEEFDIFCLLPQQSGFNVDLDIIDLEKYLNNFHVEVQQKMTNPICGFLIKFKLSKAGLTL